MCSRNRGIVVLRMRSSRRQTTSDHYRSIMKRLVTTPARSGSDKRRAHKLNVNLQRNSHHVTCHFCISGVLLNRPLRENITSQVISSTKKTDQSWTVGPESQRCLTYQGTSSAVQRGNQAPCVWSWGEDERLGDSVVRKEWAFGRGNVGSFI